MSALKTFWETYFRTPLILVNGVELPIRDVLNFITDGDFPSDDPVNERTDVPLNGLGPGGSPGQLMWHVVVDGLHRLAGTAKLVVNGATDGSELIHSGKPLHNETWADFKDLAGAGNALARPQWAEGLTANATATAIGTISVPAATYGDCAISVHAETTYVFNASGTKLGKYIRLATFGRSSGTLTRVGTVDLTPGGLAVGTAPGGTSVDVFDNDTVKLNAVGISATNIAWFTSFHVQVLKRPS